MIIKDRIEFDKLFTDFSDAVKEKKYAKMSYQLWNKIKNSLCALGEKDFVEIKNNADNIRVQFHINGNVDEYIFSWDDCSFGNFLYEKYWGKITANTNKVHVDTKDKIYENAF